MSVLCSGLIGAVLAQLLSMMVNWRERSRQKKSLLQGIIAECDYDISILAEVLEGSIERNGSFKRLSVEYFKTIRGMAAVYSLDQRIIRDLSRAIVDVEVYNREADYIFDGNNVSCVYAGLIDGNAVLINKKPELRDISMMMTNARVGVMGSLKALQESARR